MYNIIKNPHIHSDFRPWWYHFYTISPILYPLNYLLYYTIYTDPIILFHRTHTYMNPYTITLYYDLLSGIAFILISLILSSLKLFYIIQYISIYTIYLYIIAAFPRIYDHIIRYVQPIVDVDSLLRLLYLLLIIHFTFPCILHIINWYIDFRLALPNMLILI